MDWDDVRHFLALARTGSVRGAGAQLKVSHSTIARRVEALEDRLGVRLFDRHRDGYVLNDAGAQMVPAAERIEREMSALERGLAGQDARLEGRVRVTCTDPFIASLLTRHLAALCLEHPGIELELDADAKYLDLSRREADVALRALRVGDSPPGHLIGRRAAPIVIANYVAVAHRERLDPTRPGSEARWLGNDATSGAFRELLASSSYPNLPTWGSFPSMTVMVRAAHEGLGLVMLPTYVADRDPGLVRLRKADVRHVADFWLLGHKDLRDNARLRVMRERIGMALREEAALFDGTTPMKVGAKAKSCVPKTLRQVKPKRG